MTDAWISEAPEDQYRMRLCKRVAATALGLPADDETTLKYARVLFSSTIPTFVSPSADPHADEPDADADLSDDAFEDRLDLGVQWLENLHPRQLGGRFARKYGKMTAQKSEDKSLAPSAREARKAEQVLPDPSLPGTLKPGDGLSPGGVAPPSSPGGPPAPNAPPDPNAPPPTPGAPPPPSPGMAGPAMQRLDPVTSDNVQKIIQQIPPEARAQLNGWPPKMGDAATGVLGGFVDTQSKYMSGKDYAAGRLALHDSIINYLLERARRDGAKRRQIPEAHFTAGMPCSGKTYMESEGRLNLPKGFVRVDPDEIKLHLPEYQQMLHPSWTPEQIGDELARLRLGEDPTYPTIEDPPDPYAAFGVHEETYDIGRKVQQAAINEHLDTLIDGTGNGGLSEDGTSAFVNRMRSMRDAGYSVHLHYADVSLEKAMERNVRRAQRQGRWLSPEFIADTAEKVSETFREVLKQDWLHAVDIYDTGWSSQGHATRIATALPDEEPKTIADRLEILSPSGYNRFYSRYKGE